MNCTHCKKSESEMQRCSKCHNAYYCSLQCQKADWKEHKLECGVVQDIVNKITKNNILLMGLMSAASYYFTNVQKIDIGRKKGNGYIDCIITPISVTDIKNTNINPGEKAYKAVLIWMPNSANKGAKKIVATNNFVKITYMHTVNDTNISKTEFFLELDSAICKSCYHDFHKDWIEAACTDKTMILNLTDGEFCELL